MNYGFLMKERKCCCSDNKVVYSILVSWYELEYDTMLYQYMTKNSKHIIER